MREALLLSMVIYCLISALASGILVVFDKRLRLSEIKYFRRSICWFLIRALIPAVIVEIAIKFNGRLSHGISHIVSDLRDEYVADWKDLWEAADGR